MVSVLMFLVEQSGFKLWQGTLCCVLVQDNFSHSASLHPGI